MDEVTHEIVVGDCREVMRGMADASVDAIVCDPPYELGFMGKKWDSSGIAYDGAVWREALRVLRPGGHLVAFGGTRTYHRMACAIEDAGFEVRDSLHWMYGTGFPKSLDVSKAIDAAAGAEREVVGVNENAVRSQRHGGTAALHTGQTFSGATSITAPATEPARRWSGWGTALKPAHEPIVLARKPLVGTVAANVLAHGTGALNVDGCRVATTENLGGGAYAKNPAKAADLWRTEPGHENSFRRGGAGEYQQPAGRWPPNVLLSHSTACGDGCADGCAVSTLDEQGGVRTSGEWGGQMSGVSDRPRGLLSGLSGRPLTRAAESGTASRFFPTLDWDATYDAPFAYVPKAARSEREAGCGELPERTGAEAVGRAEGSAGLQSPRAGAGALAASVRNYHPTVKPIAIMRWLVRLVTPPGGLVLDPFAGSGTTGAAAALEGASFLGIELDADHAAIARARIAHWAAKARAA